MKKSLLLLLLFFSLSSKAQINTDSLKAVWNDTTISDTTRLKAAGIIAQEGFRFTNLDSAFYYAQLQFDLAKSIENKNFMILALNIQGDSYLLKGKPDEAFEILNRALKLSLELSDKKPKIRTLGNISRVLEARGELGKALEYNLQILKLSEEIQDKESIGKSLSNIGENYMKKGDFPKGIEYLNRSKNIFEELDNEYNVVKVQASMAQIYLQQGNLDEAREFILLNLAYFEKTGNKTLISGSLSNLGGIYASQGKNKKALEYLERAMVFIEESGNIPYIAGLSQNMGGIYYDEGKLERALEYLTKGLQLSEKIKNENSIASAKSKIGLILMDQGKYAKSIVYSTEALSFYQETTDVKNIEISSESLMKAYKAIGSYKKALAMNELFHQMRDSLNSEENQKAIIEMQVQSEYEKQKAIDDAQNGKLIAIETQKKEYQQNLFLAALFAILLISLLAFFNFKRYKETKRQKAIIEEQKKKVEQSEKYKEQFLANMSHEIRTPMHAISGMVKILERNDHPASQDVFLDVMKTSSDNLVVILNDVLDLSKIEAGKLDIESIPIYSSDVIKNVMQILKYKVEEKGLSFTSQISEDVPNVFMGDPTRLNQILLNIAGNAIKFTEKGNVNIALEKKEDRLIFSIKDTGVGMAESNLKNIFDAFEQAEGSISRQYGGTGLGLSISQQLTQLQGGKIWVESQEGVGSTFYVELPLLLAPIDAVGHDLISGEKLNQMAGSLTGIRVLLAEDNNFNQMIAMDDLSYYIKDVKMDIVADGLEAVNKFENGHYDLILMDVQMPNMNGFDATRAIRDLESKKGVKKPISIIAMTASLLKSEIDSCYNAGMDNYIPKPYKAEELIGPIYEELKQRHLT
ncbi:MAG: signal transduction histidine kinase/Tfp pilus assembly protein PilF [Saprospiraceae bacterium]|jgi:signal transduction histidine kinase/Tfp pilus assembly protein PilF|tara:strand:- start:247 stop:2835 length:2589 start_codon:yes stop_codon:yes gene_type:complete